MTQMNADGEGMRLGSGINGSQLVWDYGASGPVLLYLLLKDGANHFGAG